MTKPTAKTAIDILSGLKDVTGPASLAYWVTPNTILTLSGARAYCDGVFYHKDKKTLHHLVSEIEATLKILQQITDIKFSETKIDSSFVGETYVGYELITAQGLRHVSEQTSLLGSSFDILYAQGTVNKQLMAKIVALLRDNPKTKSYNDEDLNSIATGILLGYPDEAIIGSINQGTSQNEALIEADIRGARYYSCPVPIYSYPRHLVGNSKIMSHEKLWSGILEDYYHSKFHTLLENDESFQRQAETLQLQ